MKLFDTSIACPVCGGRKEDGTTTYTVDSGEGVIVVRNVKAKICVQCGEEWIDNEIAKNIRIDDGRSAGQTSSIRSRCNVILYQ